ncbi:MAG TPA: TonB-dependent receptor, partial [Chitinophagales bacterium]|nr:TonB-dependent receptor [Chitinophagales bacterium]
MDQLNIVLDEESSILDEVVVSASRVEEKILESPVTIEKLDLQTIKVSSSPDFFDQMTKLKGVTSYSGSMNFNAINTRGFGGVSNVRFVQLVDGVDNSAPLLNFPMGNLIGLTESDTRSVELLPGAASALYGPNAFNGIMIMTSKSPWDYSGLNVSAKIGVSKADNDVVHPIYNIDFRYAKAWNKVGFKITGGYFGATDWLANDYKADLKTRNTYDKDIKPANFDGVNTYGDETQIFVPFTDDIIQALKDSELSQELADNLFEGDMDKTLAFLDKRMVDLHPIDIRRTGLTEEELLDNRKATSAKVGATFYYRPKEDIDINYSFRFGSGNSIYEGDDRYALRNFFVFVNKLEAVGKDFTLRAYVTQTNAGKSYNLTALGGYANELLAPSEEAWVPNYLGNYVGLLLAASFIQNKPISRLGSNIYREAHAIAREESDAMIQTDRNQAIETVRGMLFQRDGAMLKDRSRLWHAEGTYDFNSLLKDKIGILVGANYRMYDLFTDGTVFNEDPEGTGVNERIHIGEYGAFIQATKKMIGDQLRVSASIRYDKNENFKGQFSPRVATVVTLGSDRQHNIRASFQTGFRNPDTQAQFLYFPTGASIILGGAKKNAERYGIFEGGAYSLDSYNKFLQSAVDGKADTSLLKVFYMDYISPEKLSTIELGYKSLV